VAHVLEDGDLLVIGHDIDELNEIGQIVKRALLLGIVPSLVLAVVIGIFLSLRAQKRIEDVNKAVQRIVAGDLRERLSTRGTADSFDKLATIVNGMLDEIETLIRQIAGVGDDIAHDLRTPLTRVRASLERGCKNADTVEDFQLVVERAIQGLDKSLAIITALLRIAEIEHGKRLSSFGEVDLAEVMHEAVELYDPIAEDRGIHLDIEATEGITVRGDRDLLFEALANLIDNALKFTPPGGRVELHLLRLDGRAVMQIADTGPGIAEAERDAVTRRFYRSDRARRTQGVGLGLNLVAAIFNLHGFRWTISTGPGCTIEITCSL
jgi:signal transduction histidine kinase